MILPLTTSSSNTKAQAAKVRRTTSSSLKVAPKDITLYVEIKAILMDELLQ